MSRASEDLLGMLHGMIAKRYIEMLEGKDEDGKPVALSAADLSNMLRFLKDNNITCAIGGDNEMDDLLKSLNVRKQTVATTNNTDLENALAQMGHIGGMN